MDCSIRACMYDVLVISTIAFMNGTNKFLKCEVFLHKIFFNELRRNLKSVKEEEEWLDGSFSLHSNNYSISITSLRIFHQVKPN